MGACEDYRAKSAIVTGGNKGVGRGVVYSLVKAGMRVCICYNSSEDFALETLGQANKLAAGGAFLYKCDVSIRDNVRAMVAETAERFGGVDLLVNNAALQPNYPLGHYEPALFRKIWDVNVGGCFICVQECLPHLKRSECARIVNISSIHAKRPSVFDAGYSMTKNAIKMFTREAAVELAKYKITVNYITLGACRIERKTGDFGGVFSADMPQDARTVSSFPLGRTAVPQDVGDLIAYIAGEQSEIITGAGIRIDGGSALL